MIVSINQPAYFPWLGYLHRIAISDVHVVLDHVQFEKNSFTNRNRVRTKDGQCWITVPLKTKGKFGQLAIDTLEIDNSANWADKHWQTLRCNYSRAPYFRDHAPFLESLYAKPWIRLNDLMRELTCYLLGAFEIDTPLLYSSAMNCAGKNSDLVLEICRVTRAQCYLSGPLGRNYLDEDEFRAANIQLVYHDYRHPTYRQAYPGFEPFMSAFDLLFNHGPNSHGILFVEQENTIGSSCHAIASSH
jgi:hypothetical protein